VFSQKYFVNNIYILKAGAKYFSIYSKALQYSSFPVFAGNQYLLCGSLQQIP